ncbi:MAG: methyltransferase domain-containing protein [Terricaulis sp.]
MRIWFFSAAAAALLLGACAGGAIPPLGLAAPATAQVTNTAIDAALADPKRPAADTARDEFRHPREVLQFVHLRPGMRIADVGPGGGYYTRLFADLVGPSGHVYGIDRPNRAPDQPRAILAVAPQYDNVSVVQQGYLGWTVDQPLDVIFISQIYHDFHLTDFHFDVAEINRDMFAQLKPGGELIIIDHAANAGADVTSTADTLHRIDQAAARRELEAAGFVFVDESQVLRNPADTHAERVFDSDIRGHTDQFVMRFRKPG